MIVLSCLALFPQVQAAQLCLEVQALQIGCIFTGDAPIQSGATAKFSVQYNRVQNTCHAALGGKIRLGDPVFGSSTLTLRKLDFEYNCHRFLSCTMSTVSSSRNS